MRAVREVDFLACAIISVGGYRVSRLVMASVAAVRGVVEIVGERAHGVAVVSRHSCAFLREPQRKPRHIWIVPEEGTRADDEPGVCEEAMGYGWVESVNGGVVGIEFRTLCGEKLRGGMWKEVLKS